MNNPRLQRTSENKSRRGCPSLKMLLKGLKKKVEKDQEEKLNGTKRRRV